MQIDKKYISLLLVLLSFRMLLVGHLGLIILRFFLIIYVVSEERCNEVESLVFDLFANLGATGTKMDMFILNLLVLYLKLLSS